MYRTPSSRKRKKNNERINLIPILDSVFIFIFFLLMSANFLKVFEIQSDVPTVSDAPPPKTNEKPLALTIQINKDNLTISTGIPARVVKVLKNPTPEVYDLNGLHDYLVNLKKDHLKENTAILEPKFDVEYDKLINIMDSIRLFRDTDEAMFMQDKDGVSKKIEMLFGNIVFGNIMS